NVSAKDKATGKSQDITIKSSSGLSDEEIERMVNEAEQYAEEDKKRKEQVEIRNNADQLIFTTEKTLKDLGDKVDAAELEKDNEAKDKLKKTLEGDDSEAIKQASEELEKVVQELSVKLYQQAQQAQQDQQEADGSKESDD